MPEGKSAVRLTKRTPTASATSNNTTRVKGVDIKRSRGFAILRHSTLRPRATLMRSRGVMTDRGNPAAAWAQADDPEGVIRLQADHHFSVDRVDSIEDFCLSLIHRRAYD